MLKLDVKVVPVNGAGAGAGAAAQALQGEGFMSAQWDRRLPLNLKGWIVIIPSESWRNGMAMRLPNDAAATSAVHG